MAKSTDFQDIQNWANNTTFDSNPFILDQCTIICNKRKFVDVAIRTLKANKGKKILMPLYNKLLKFYKLNQNGKQ